MSGFTAWALQVAIFDALINDANIQASSIGDNIFDKVPEDQPYPFITFGDSNESDGTLSTKTSNGQDHFFVIEIMSNYGGRQEIKEIQALIYDALHEKSLTLSSGVLLLIRYETSSNIKLDEFKYLGEISFRALTEE